MRRIEETLKGKDKKKWQDVARNLKKEQGQKILKSLTE